MVKPLDPTKANLSQEVLDHLTTTPGASTSQTVAKGTVADLAAAHPGLAADLADIGKTLRDAGMKEVTSGKLRG